MQHPSAEQGRKGSTLIVAQWQVDKCMEKVPQQQISALSCITNTMRGRRHVYSYCHKAVWRTSEEGEAKKWWFQTKLSKPKAGPPLAAKTRKQRRRM